jgi:hypothetical protein
VSERIAPIGTTWEVWLDGNWKSTTRTAEDGEKDLQYYRLHGVWKETCELTRIDRVRVGAFDVRQDVEQ